ncbi:response regulator transcription factor [Alteromonas sp. SM 2104]|nr:response regulator transcription factor [Alteromonas oceanisediminis]
MTTHIQTPFKTNVLIADDHPLFRAAMRRALHDVIDGEILEVDAFQGARLQLQENQDIELVFLDLSMPGNEGLTGLTQLRNEFPNTLVVIVSAQDEAGLIRRAMTLGSSGYIPKSTPLPQIVEAVKTVLNGENWLPSDIVLDVAETQEDQFLAKLAQLTPHQFTVLKLIANGLLNKQIAHELSISESTVKQHVSAVLKKLNVINRTQASVMFRQIMNTEPTAK